MHRAAEDRPIFVLGRQHSGNTMLTMMLNRHSAIYGNLGESRLFERIRAIGRLGVDEKIERLVHHVGRAAQPALDEPTRDRLRGLLRAAFTDDARASLPDMVSSMMHQLAGEAGKERWAQKATSYVFYTDVLRDVFPQGRFIFLARNPFDIAASLKRRGDARDFVRSVLAWNRGVGRAYTIAEADPERFRILRYEDVVRSSEAIMRDLMRFLGIAFEPQQIDIPHINRSEKKYTLASNSSGLTDDRVFYFRNTLTSEEIGLIKHYARIDLIESYYPELADDMRRVTKPSFAMCLRGLIDGGVGFGERTWMVFREDPRSAFDRIITRLRA